MRKPIEKFAFIKNGNHSELLKPWHSNEIQSRRLWSQNIWIWIQPPRLKVTPIWLMSILMFAWRVGDNQVELRSDVFLNSYGGWHAITLQWCFHSNKMSIISHSYVSAFWLQSHILRCGLDGTPMFWNGKPAGRDSVAHARESRMEHFVKSSRSESTGRWQAASVRERFVFVRQYIFLLSLS